MLTNRYIKREIELFETWCENRGIHLPKEEKEKLLDKKWKNESKARLYLSIIKDELESRIEYVKALYQRLNVPFPEDLGYIELRISRTSIIPVLVPLKEEEERFKKLGKKLPDFYRF